MFRARRRAIADRVDGGEADLLHFWSREVDEAMKSYRRHDMDEQASRLAEDRVERQEDYLVTLSKEWNTIEFLHMAIATALFPYARQYVLMKSFFD